MKKISALLVIGIFLVMLYSACTPARHYDDPTIPDCDMDTCCTTSD
jgi:hypothetical protein